MKVLFGGLLTLALLICSSLAVAQSIDHSEDYSYQAPLTCETTIQDFAAAVKHKAVRKLVLDRYRVEAETAEGVNGKSNLSEADYAALKANIQNAEIDFVRADSTVKSAAADVIRLCKLPKDATIIP